MYFSKYSKYVRGYPQQLFYRSENFQPSGKPTLSGFALLPLNPKLCLQLVPRECGVMLVHCRKNIICIQIPNYAFSCSSISLE